MEAAAGSPGIIEMIQVMESGQCVISYPDIPVPICYFSLEGETPQQFEARIQFITNQINFSVTQKQ